MILEIQHETRVEYPSAVTEAFTELRMEPTSDAHQSCRSFHLRISPAVETHRYQDGFGNRVHHINILAPHQVVTILSASVVETHPRGIDLASCPSAYPLREEDLPLEAVAFSSFHGPVRPTESLKPVLDDLRPVEGENLGALVAKISLYIKTKFKYAPAVTAASSPIDDVLSHGMGVCQDFAHLMIAILRSRVDSMSCLVADTGTAMLVTINSAFAALGGQASGSRSMACRQAGGLVPQPPLCSLASEQC